MPYNALLQTMLTYSKTNLQKLLNHRYRDRSRVQKKYVLINKKTNGVIERPPGYA
jgi:hypothetical protein